MENKSSTLTQQNLKAIGWYQSIGAGIGIVFVLWALVKTQDVSPLIIVIFSVALLFFMYSVYCALLCFENKKTALIHSLINQSLQVIGFFLFGIGFFYVAGVYLTFVADFMNAGDIRFGIGLSQFSININRAFDLQEIHINVIAIGMIAWIVHLRRRIHHEQTATVNMDINSI